IDETNIIQPFLNNRNDQTQISHINRTSVVAPVLVRTNPTETIVIAPLVKPVGIEPAIDSTQNKKQEDHKAKWSWAVQASTGFSSLQTALLTRTATTPVLYDNIFNSSAPPPAALNLKPSEIEM